MQDRPIGIFDSGLGGLTAVKEITKILPNEDIIYFGDTLRAPYGDKDYKIITEYTKQIVSFLKNHNVKYILAACGTISSVVNFSDLDLYTPINGIMFSTCSVAVKKTKNYRIGVIGTVNTIKSNAYKNMISSLLPKATVYQQACPMFVPLIESGKAISNNSVLYEYAKKYLLPLKDSDIDILILGCTHYPIIKDIIQNVMGLKIQLVEPGKESAEFVFNEMKNQNLISTKSSSGKIEFFITGDKQKFLQTANAFLMKDISKNTKVVDIK